MSASAWHARLELGFSRLGARTVLSHRRHVGPLVVQRPFYPEGGTCHVYLVHPPAGIVGGDALELQATLAPGAHALITTPSATRFYRAGPHPRASLSQHFTVHDASLEWLPQENIFFDGARARAVTRVDLAGDARFFGWEIGCLGRPANAETFTTGLLQQDFLLYHDGRPLLLDRQRLAGSAAALSASWGLAGAQASGTLLMYPAAQFDMSSLRLLDTGSARLAMSLVDGVLVCRAIAVEAEPIRKLFTRIWLETRAMLLGQEAVAPRIWAT